jgi:hypothetical protein
MRMGARPAPGFRKSGEKWKVNLTPLYAISVALSETSPERYLMIARDAVTDLRWLRWQVTRARRLNSL